MMNRFITKKNIITTINVGAMMSVYMTRVRVRVGVRVRVRVEVGVSVSVRVRDSKIYPLS
jgi:hypothetical protein